MENNSVGQIGLDLVVNDKGFKKQMTGIEGLAKKAGVALAGAFAVKKLVDFGKSCIDLGSNLSEVQNVVDVTFPAMTKKVDEFSKKAAANFGLSETMAKKYTGTFGAMSKAFGFSESAAYDMGTTLTGLAGDVASFYNLSQDEAYTKLKSVFTGETESLKDLGVVMTQTALDSYAMSHGFGKTTAKMSEAEKVALRYKFVQDQLSASSGDFARTSGSWANQMRILTLQFESFKATIGQGLINVFTPVLKAVNALIGRLMTLANAFKSFTEMIFGSGGSPSGTTQLAETAAGLTDSANAADSLSDAAGGVGSAAKKAAKEMQNLMGFDQINKVSEQDNSDSGAGGISAGTVDFGSINDGETAADKLSEKFQKLFEGLRNQVQPTVDSLKRLWNEGLSKLGDFAWTGLKDFYDGFLKPVASWTLGEGIPRFIDALNDGLMKIDFQKINDALKRLWDVLAPFAINVGEGLLWFWEKVLVPLGTWTANEVVPRFLDTLSNVIKILNSVIEALEPLFEWFWDKVLQPLAQWTGDLFLKAWDGINKALESFSGWCEKNPGVIQGVATAITAFFAAFQIGKIANVALEMATYVINAGGLTAALKLMTAGLVKNTAAFFSNMAAKIADKAETAAIVALYVKDFIVSLAKSTAALVKQAAQFAINTAAKIANAVAQAAMTAATLAWNVVCVIATTLTTALGAAFAFLTSPIGLVVLAIGAVVAAGVLLYKNWDTVKEKLGQFASAMKQKFSEMKKDAVEKFNDIKKKASEKFSSMKDSVSKNISSASETLNKAFNTDWTKYFGSAGETMNAFMKNAQNILNGVKQIFQGFMTFVSGVFTGDWSKAWNGIKTIFKGVWDSFIAIAKSPLNTIIGFINKFLSGMSSAINKVANKLNSVKIDIPDWLGGGTLNLKVPTMSIPSIPYLAQGGYVKANTPQLAMIGDNKTQGEIVAPEDKLLEMAKMAADSGNAQVIALLRELIILIKDLDLVKLDPESLRKYFIKTTNNNTKARGKSELIPG